jgi:hypothetical protein
MKTQRGAAALPITLMLAFVLLMGVAFANRSVLFEVRSAINEVQAAQAHEAAQAGLNWALAQLNRSSPIGDDCRATESATATPWHEQALRGVVHASCTAQGSAWACHCPISGDAASVAAATSPAFSLQLSPDAGEWQLSVTGHSGRPGPAARLQMRIGRLPALDTLPAAALTVRGATHIGAGLALHHTAPASGGVTLQAGGAVDAVDLRLASTPGTPSQTSVVSLDTALASLTPQGLHASVFRLERQAWREQPAVHELGCAFACDTALRTAALQHTLLSVTGGLRLDTPVTLGTPERPVLLVVDGPVIFNASVVIYGLVYTRHSGWTDTGGARIHGAVIAENDLHTQGSTQIHHDAAVLQALQERSGTFAPVAGSWRDL